MTAVAEKTKQEKPFTVVASKDIPIDSIRVESNFRKSFDPKRLAELAENIGKVGVLEPILVRQIAEGYILIAGERRLRAAKSAGLQVIPARVLKVTPEQADEIQALENLHRENLGPIEEARAFKILVNQGKYTAESLGERMDKSTAYVYRALALNDLPENMIEAIEKKVLTPAHGHQVLRLPEGELRDAGVKYALETDFGGAYKSALDLRDYVQDRLGNDLNHAVFPRDKVYANQVACTKCPYNSGNQGALFDGAEKGKCTNSPCFQGKTEFYFADAMREFENKMAGLQFLGEKDHAYKGDKIKAYILITSTNEKDFKATLKTALAAIAKTKEGKPLPYGWMFQKTYQGAVVWIATIDKAAMKKAIGHVPGQALTSSSGQPSARTKFIEKYVDIELLKAAAARVQTSSRQSAILVLEALLSDGCSQMVWEALGIKVDENENHPDIKKLEGDILEKAAVLIAMVPFDSVEESKAEALIDVKKIAQKARLQAAEIYDQAEKK